MEGLSNRESGTYITILNGAFAQRVQPGDEGAKERINKMGKVVYERYYQSFTGFLTSINVKEDTGFGKSWNFGFTLSSGQKYFIQMPYSSSNSSAFLAMLPNIDLEKPITLSPSMKMVDGKNKTSLFVNQDNKPVKHFYTKDTPNGCPPMRQIKVKGQDVWDDTDRLEFLQNMVNTEILPKLNQKPIATVSAPSALENFDAAPVTGEEEPF